MERSSSSKEEPLLPHPLKQIGFSHRNDTDFTMKNTLFVVKSLIDWLSFNEIASKDGGDGNIFKTIIQWFNDNVSQIREGKTIGDEDPKTVLEMITTPGTRANAVFQYIASVSNSIGG